MQTLPMPSQRFCAPMKDIGPFLVFFLALTMAGTVSSNAEKQQRKGVTPKDFTRENKLRIKKIQAENRERRRQEVKIMRTKRSGR
ncbi:hypothetical protein PsorP6_008251 [Peronosclerospora sorghi]|uniref:Uncharacterized protein n=1 Tax=Peronosclerospora sorghi TaxID=230839 RepID=A0ACC0W788_9STRA|nr:hypothetical protein PsorP6_008251 [Peronosclerospora sorghi]